jgi:(R)-2-hydroxyglutarate dehydrogenase
MIPQLTEKDALSQVVLAFVNALTRRAFTGDVETHYGGRLSAATDSSIYQVTPQAVLFPRSQADVQCILQLATQDEFANVTFTARGGGTGTNGQSLTEGVVVDLSRHMNRLKQLGCLLYHMGLRLGDTSRLRNLSPSRSSYWRRNAHA